MPEIQSPDPGRKLQEKYNLIGTTPAPFLSPELVPVVLIDDLTEADPGFRVAYAADRRGAAAGELSQTRLTNRTGSGMIIQDVRLTIYLITAAARFAVFQGGPALSVTVAAFWADQTLPGSPGGIVTAGSDVGAVTEQIYEGQALPNTQVAIDFPGVRLGEGQRLHYATETVAIELAFTWQWAELPA